MYTVTLILPTDITLLEDKLNQVLVDIVYEKLNNEEIGLLIKRLEQQER